MKQKKEFDYSQLPLSWINCFVGGCPKASTCLRHTSGQAVPESETFGLAVYPTALTADGCRHYLLKRKIRAAYGFKTIFNDVKAREAPELRKKMKEYLGSHAAYYRYNDGRRLLTPEQQLWIIDLFRSYGYTDNLVFDHYRMTYDLVGH